MEEAPVVPCRVCGSSRLSPMVRGRDRFIKERGGGFLVAWCEECSCGTTQISLDRDYWEEAYPDRYFTEMLGVGPALDRMDQLGHVEATGAVSGLRVLEIGCSAGDLLCLLRERGAIVTGVEPGEIPRRLARSRGLDVVATLEDLEASQFDVGILFDVLEHLPSPVGAVRWIAERLAPNGRVVIGVPNIESLEFRLLRGRWFALELPRHLSHFSPRTMERLATLAGLAVQQIYYPRTSFFAKSFVDPRLKDGVFARGDDLVSRAVRFGFWMGERALFHFGNRPCLVAVLIRAEQ